MVAAGYADVLEVVDLGGGAQLLADQRLYVAVGDLLLLVGQLFEGGEGVVEVSLVQREAQLQQPFLEGMPAAELAQHQRAGRNAHGPGVHYLVGVGLLDDAVLVDAGLVAEGIGAHDGLVWAAR